MQVELRESVGSGTASDDSAARKGLPAEVLVSSLYTELRKLAGARLTAEGDTCTLQPTALVHEAWLRLASSTPQAWESQGHFFAAAAEAMRRILIDRARRKQALKRAAGAKAERLNLDQIDIAVHTEEESLLRIDDALQKLAKLDPLAAEVVKLRFFVGLCYSEAAQVMGISERSAKRCWTFARAWLYRELGSSARSLS